MQQLSFVRTDKGTLVGVMLGSLVLLALARCGSPEQTSPVDMATPTASPTCEQQYALLKGKRASCGPTGTAQTEFECDTITVPEAVKSATSGCYLVCQKKGGGLVTLYKPFLTGGVVYTQLKDVPIDDPAREARACPFFN